MTATLVLPQRVLFDTVDSSRGTAELDVTTNIGQFTNLKAGRTYLLQGALRSVTPSHTLSYNWYDVTGAVALGSAAWVEAVNSTGGTNSQPMATAVFTPLVDSVVELRIVATNSTGNDVDAFYSYASVVEIGAVQADVVGGLEFMDIIEVAAPATNVDFGATGDGAFQRALDGDADYEYVIVGRWVLPDATSTFMTFMPNASPIDAQSTVITGAGAAAPTGAAITQLRVATPAADEDYVTFKIEFDGATGYPRGYRCHSAGFNTVDTTTRTEVIGGGWDDNSTNITSLRLSSAAGSAIAAGSRFTLYRRTRNNVRADTAGIYERTAQATVAQGTNAATTYALGGATFGGSAVGISARLVDDTVTSGSITIDLKVNSIVVLTATLDSTSSTFARAADVSGANPVAFGEDIEIDVTTTGLVTSGAGTPGVVLNATLINNAYVQSPIGPHYLYGRLSANQTVNINAGNHVEFDTFKVVGDSIAPSTGSGQQLGLFTLQPGKTYEMHAYVRCQLNEGSVSMRWVNDAGDVGIVDDSGVTGPAIFQQDNVATDAADNSAIMCLFTPTVETTVKLEIQSETNLVIVYQTGLHVMIKELK
jgi:hypothetical protein